ncbi:MAG TPA: efflux RND transporter periplasmic adaptor subunit [Gammaproteobacteria bacterium]|nr:efflux RND transporter periplasmic adaptor subunit [Gammaproteobacteria bacterium]
MKKKPVVITILAIIGVSLIIYGIYAFGIYQMIQKYSSMTPPPTTVSATTAEKVQWQPRISAVGSIRAVQGVDISNEVAGRVEKILFESGAHVEKGDLLVQLDDSIEQAQLPGAQAQLELARSNYERTQKLVEQGLASEEQLDSAQSQLTQAQSAVKSLQATLSKKAVRAPFSGTLGIRQVDIGQYLAPGTKIVTLQALDKLYVDFALPEQYLGRVKPGQTVRLTTSVAPDKVFTGNVSAVGIKLDPSTRNFTVRATLENPEHILHPGMFADLAVLAGDPVPVISIPEAAVTYSLYGDAVYIITEKQPDDKKSASEEKAEGKEAAAKTASDEPVLIATQTFVELGESRHGDVAVIKGVSPGDRVVTAGQLKLQRESRVVINNTVELD